MRHRRKSGQAVTEFILMLAILTVIGIWILTSMTGSGGQGGAVKGMTSDTAGKIAND